ncbi:FAM135A [Symbiodinium microadriaticum]|nr:FAM135A [Symbiodinium microadriaticum]
MEEQLSRSPGSRRQEHSEGRTSPKPQAAQAQDLEQGDGVSSEESNKGMRRVRVQPGQPKILNACGGCRLELPEHLAASLASELLLKCSDLVFQQVAFACFLLLLLGRMMRREHAPLGPYYVRAGKAGPVPQGSACEKSYGPGKPKPDLGTRPDTWSSWPRLLPALLPAEGALPSTVVRPDVTGGLRTPGCMPAGTVMPRASARAQEDAQWHRFAQEWLHRLQSSLSVAPLLCDLGLGELAQESLLRVLQCKAPATLRRHLIGWKLWSAFASEQSWNQYNPSAHALIVFFMALAESKRESPAALASQKFVAAILGWASWLRTLENPVVLAWCGNKRRQKARKEALPLPLYVVAAFEQAVLQEPPTGSEHAKDVRLLTAFLLMLWGALRYSDPQRVLVSDLCCENGLAQEGAGPGEGMRFLLDCVEEERENEREIVKKQVLDMAGQEGRRSSHEHSLATSLPHLRGSTAMSLCTVVELALQFESFRNVDLFHQGLYHLKTRIYRDDEGRALAFPYSYLKGPSMAMEPPKGKPRVDHHNLIPAHVNEEMYTFSTRSFLIRYCEEEVELGDVGQFRLELSPSELERRNPLLLEVELMFADLTQHPSEPLGDQPDVESAEFRCVSTQVLRLRGVERGLHDFCPVVFDECHFCLLNLAVHSAVVDLRFRVRPALRKMAATKPKVAGPAPRAGAKESEAQGYSRPLAASR